MCLPPVHHHWGGNGGELAGAELASVDAPAVGPRALGCWLDLVLCDDAFVVCFDIWVPSLRAPPVGQDSLREERGEQDLSPEASETPMFKDNLSEKLELRLSQPAMLGLSGDERKKKKGTIQGNRVIMRRVWCLEMDKESFTMYEGK